jgi:pimeloyl-ACP methyl ester carboxylesterase
MMQTGSYKNEVEIVRNLTVPLAILHGKEDQFVNGEYFNRLQIPTLWRNAVQYVPHAGHNIQWERPSLFNYLLAKFVLEVNR